MLQKKVHSGVVFVQVLFLVLFVFIGVSQVLGATPSAQPESLKVSEPKSLGISKQESLGVSESKSLGVSEPKSLEVSNSKSLESGGFKEGRYTPAERENAEYLRCAAKKEFSDRYKCALEGLGITQE